MATGSKTSVKAATCLIPFFNEGPRVLNVIKAVKKCKYINQIVCVDDGSEDNAAYTLYEKYPEVTLVRLVNNRGKAAAIRAGLDHVKNDTLVLLDADISHFGVETSQ